MRKRAKKKNRLLFLILFFAVVILIGQRIYQRYSFTNERVDLNEYIGVSGKDVVIYLNDEKQDITDETVKNVAKCEYDSVYLPLSFVKARLNNRFYYAKDVEKIFYCLSDEIKQSGDTDIHQIGNAPYVLFYEEPYLLIDYVKDYTNIRYDKYIDDENKRVFIYNDWDRMDIAHIKSRESARVHGGNKSLVITDLHKGEEVKILHQMTKWVKIKTSNGYIGYIRKSKISKIIEEIPKSDYLEKVRTGTKHSTKPCIGFHQVTNIYASSKLPELLRNTNGMNVIAPTWFIIKDEEGSIMSNANDAYAQYCHGKKLSVWATINNFDQGKINNKKLFSSYATRRRLIDRILREVEVNSLDGVNLDMEGIEKEAGEDYTEFVRELSIELTKIGCILSIDTYVPYKFNSQYDLKEYNDFCDYVVIMCYDEHYDGSTETGSVSSIGYVKDGINLSLVNVDKDKLIIALPFYSRIWKTGKDGTISSTAAGSLAIETSAKAQGLSFSFDDETCQNYGYKLTQDGVKVECWLEDDVSLAYKMKEIRDAKLAGTAAWKLTQERENYFNVINLNNK